MKLLRHLLSHVILILVLFGIVSLYYYRHHVLPVQYAEKIDVYADKIHPKLKSFVRTKKIDNEAPSVEVVVQENVAVPESTVEEDKTIVESAAIETAIEQKASLVEDKPSKYSSVETLVSTADVDEKNVAVNDVAVKNIQEEKETVVETDKSALVVEEVTTDEVDKATEISSPYEVTEKVAAPDLDKEAASVNDLLRAARFSFNKGDLAGSVAQYNLLIELDNDEPDFYGELGNVYYAMGRWEEAGLAYYEAATRLIEKRQLYQVHYLQRVIHGLDAERAEKLASQLASLNH